jgi:hypothetical protein
LVEVDELQLHGLCHRVFGNQVNSSWQRPELWESPNKSEIEYIYIFTRRSQRNRSYPKWVCWCLWFS